MVPQCIALATITTEPVSSITPTGFRSTWAGVETIGMAVVDFWKFVPNGSCSLFRRVSAAPILFQFGNLHEFVACVGAQPTHASTPIVIHLIYEIIIRCISLLNKPHPSQKF